MSIRKPTPRARLAVAAIGAALLACGLPAAVSAAAPPVTITPSRSPDVAGWYNHAVTFTASSTALGATCDPPVTYTGPDSSTASVTMHCTDTAGNVGSATTVFQYDATAPVTTATLSPATPNGANGWYLGSVGLSLSGFDPASGIATIKMNGGGGPVPAPFARAAGKCLNRNLQTYTSPVEICGDGRHAVDYYSIDRAGNVEGTQTVRVKIDGHAPTVGLTTPADGAVVRQDKALAAKFRCGDKQSGIDTCVGTVANGSNIDTSTVGPHTFTVTGTDLAGNHTTVTHHYQVVYAWNGFFAPVTNTETSKLNLVHAGDLIRLGFSLNGDHGLDVFAAGFPTSVSIACPAWTPHSVPAAGAGSTAGLSYGVASGHYTYGWQTEAAWAGTCRRFEIKLNDGTTTLHTADFMLFA